MAGEMRQEWTWRDIFRSIGLAFSFTRLMIGFLGLAVFAAADGLMTWAVMAAEKAGVAPGTWAMRGIVCGRWIVAGYLFLFIAAAIAYSAKGELLEGEGAGVKESIGFVFRKFGAIFWTPVLFWGFVGVMGGLAFVFFMSPALIMRLFGTTLLVSLCWYAATFLFTVLFAVLAMLGFLAFLFSLFLAPPVIATRQEGALDATLDSIDLMRGKGAFWVAILVLMVSGFIGVCVLGKTMDVTYRVSNLVMEGDFRKMVVAMPEQIKPRKRTILELAKMYWPGEYRATVARLARKGGLRIELREGGFERALKDQRATARRHPLLTRYQVAGWIFGIWVLIVAGFLVSFTVGAVVSAATLTYLIVREEDEFLEPTAVEVPPPAAKPAAKPEEKPAEKKEEGEKEKKEEKEGEGEDKKGDKPKKSKRKKKKD